ncbi:hypothetical protein ACTXT7_004749 [Hymenolepis weldensis]
MFFHFVPSDNTFDTNSCNHNDVCTMLLLAVYGSKFVEMLKPNIQPSFHVILVALIYWTKESYRWQIIFGFVVIDPPMPSRLTFICRVDDT